MAESERSDGLNVAIGVPGAVMLVIGGVIGVGIFVNPAVVARFLPSPALILAAWAVGGVVALLGAFVYAELAARLPATGGEYQYLRTAYGPLAAFLFGWTTLLVVHAGGLAAVTIVLAKNVGVLTGGRVADPWTVVVTLAVLAGVNCLGVKSGDKTQGVLGVLKVAAIVAIVVAGLAIAPRIAHSRPALAAAGGSNLVKSFGAALVPVLFSYGGWQTANYVAGEVKQSSRSLAVALVVGVIAVIVLYILVNVACLRALGVSELGATLTPASDVLGRAFGPVGAKLAAGAVALSALAFLSQGMLTGPRVIYAMARDGLFFRAAGRVATSRAPAVAIVIVAAWTAVLALSGSFERILSYVIAMNFLFFGISASTLFVLRRRGVGDGGFRAPLHPWSTGLFILACVVVVGGAFWSFPKDSLIGYAIMAAGIPPYLYWRRRSSRALDG
ncbi:MAG: APC family permease [Caulobacteraceae bacterium]